mgnify:CR=1 FL=1
MKYFLVITALLICSTIKAEEKQIASPDGKIVVTISDKNGQPIASVIRILLLSILLLWDLLRI